MGREHAPKPGASWGRELVRRQVLAADGPVPTEEAQAFADSFTEVPQSAALNREQRRAMQRARRRKGRQR